MAAVKEHILKEAQRFKVEYRGTGHFSRKIEKIGYKFIFENVGLIESISVVQKPTAGGSSFDYSDYVVHIDCGNEFNANKLIEALNNQYPQLRIDNLKTVVFDTGGIDVESKAINFVKSLPLHIFSLRPSDREKMMSMIYSMLGELQLCTYTRECLNAGDIEETIKLNRLISNPSYGYTYQIAKKLEEANRINDAITHYKEVSLSDREYTNAQYRLYKLTVEDTPEAKIKRFKYLVRSGEIGIPHLDTVFLRNLLHAPGKKEIKKINFIACNKKLDMDVIMHLAEQFDSLAAETIVDNLCTTLHQVLSEHPYRPCIARYNLLLAKRLGNSEEIASNPVLQATFYNHCLVASLASKKFRANEILIEQMQKDLASQSVTLFLSNVLKLSLESTAILYHAAMALMKQERPLLASCLLQRVRQNDNEVFFKLAAKENLTLAGIVLANRADMDRIGSCIDMCVSAGTDNIVDSVAKIGANFEEKISAPNASSSSDSRVQDLERQMLELKSQVESLSATVESLKSQLTARPESRRKHHSSKASSSSDHSMFSEKSRHSHRHHKESKQIGEEVRQDTLSGYPV